MGQQHIPIQVEGKKEPVAVDKDCPLFKELLGCMGSYEDMSPLVVPSGYTRNYLNMTGSEQLKLRQNALRDITQAYNRIAKESEFVVLEGTGHTAVGSIVGMNNAQIAAHLDVPMVMVVNGGIGSSYDEFYLNQCVIAAEGAKLAGVLVNKCDSKKVQQVREYLEKALAGSGVPIIGVVPDKEFFESPCARDFETLFNTKLMAGKVLCVVLVCCCVVVAVFVLVLVLVLLVVVVVVVVGCLFPMQCILLVYHPQQKVVSAPVPLLHHHLLICRNVHFPLPLPLHHHRLLLLLLLYL